MYSFDLNSLAWAGNVARHTSASLHTGLRLRLLNVGLALNGHPSVHFRHR